MPTPGAKRSQALDFTAEMAIPKLLEWGLATRDGEGNLVAAPLEVALLLLDKLWDNQFDVSRGEGLLLHKAGRRVGGWGPEAR